MSGASSSRGAAWLAGTLALLSLLSTLPQPVHAQSAEHASVETVPAQGQVNLNTASAEELQRLPGVGPSRAEAILAYRDRRPFRRVEELMRIPGIGRKTFRRLRPLLTLEGPTTL